MSLAMSKQEREQFLMTPRVAIISIAEAGRGPLAVPVWYDYARGGELWFLTQRDSRKGRLLETVRRISLTVQDDQPPYSYVSVEGPIVAIEPYEIDRDLRPMAERYRGTEAGAAYAEGMRGGHDRGNSIKVRMRPERWLTADYGKRAAAG